jgi:hypothetical protein
MNFKAYDILSSLIPGFLIVLVLLNAFDIKYDNSMVVAYTAIAFLFGYLMNTISSWLEDFYFFTWGGKPSNRLLDGKGIWKVKFYHHVKAKNLLSNDCSNPNAKNDELFFVAMRYANGSKDTRVDDFNALYAFSRSLLTTVFIGTIILIFENYKDWRYYVTLIPSLLIVWLRCKQRAYYYVREVLNIYLKSKNA